jgi:hypothetical protein
MCLTKVWWTCFDKPLQTVPRCVLCAEEATTLGKQWQCCNGWRWQRWRGGEGERGEGGQHRWTSKIYEAVWWHGLR